MEKLQGQDHNPDGDHVLGAMDVSIVGKLFSRSDTTPDTLAETQNGLQGTLGAPRPIFKFKGNCAATGLSGSHRDEVGFQKSGKFCSGSVRGLF